LKMKVGSDKGGVEIFASNDDVMIVEIGITQVKDSSLTRF
jgi:hypothetical protein